MTNADDADVHEWISFEDDEELRTWEFDATFLRSNYRCIWGCGCQGVHDEPTPELMQGCWGGRWGKKENTGNINISK